MLKEEYAIGNYFNPTTTTHLDMSVEDRKNMVQLLQELNEAENWKDETLHLAVNIADRYLIYLAINGQSAPCLVNLSVTSLMIAGKIELPFAPSFAIMNKILGKKH